MQKKVKMQVMEDHISSCKVTIEVLEERHTYADTLTTKEREEVTRNTNKAMLIPNNLIFKKYKYTDKKTKAMPVPMLTMEHRIKSNIAMEYILTRTIIVYTKDIPEEETDVICKRVTAHTSITCVPFRYEWLEDTYAAADETRYENKDLWEAIQKYCQVTTYYKTKSQMMS